ncbi:DUF6059 family protein [Nocardia sp. NPDC055321]
MPQMMSEPVRCPVEALVTVGRTFCAMYGLVAHPHPPDAARWLFSTPAGHPESVPSTDPTAAEELLWSQFGWSLPKMR